MTIKRISSGSEYEPKIGYCRAVVAGDWIHVSGTTGPDPVTRKFPDAVEDQCRNAFAIIQAALAEAGASMADAVRVTYILPDGNDFEKCWPVLSSTFAGNPPAATMIEARLLDPAMKIEIELTCYRPK